MNIVDTIKHIIKDMIHEIDNQLNCVKLKVEIFDGCECCVPEKIHPSDAGFDLKAAINKPVVIAPGECKVISVGFACALPEGYELQIRPRSGLAAKYYVSVLNTPGTVDCNYRGPVSVILFNFGKYPYEVHPNDRIAQGVVCKLPKVIIEKVKVLDDTDRGTGGFGSTGK